MFFIKKKLLATAAVLSVATLPLSAARTTSSTKVVDFGKCYTESQYGKKEQEGFNQMKNQMENAIKNLNDQMSETSAKLEDEFVRDGLSPQAEKDLQEKMQTLSGELQRYQQQYYYMLQQANMKTMNVMADKVREASSKLAEEQNYAMVISKEQVFHYKEKLDVTADVIKVLDDMYEAETANLASVKKELSKAESMKSETSKAK